MWRCLGFRQAEIDRLYSKVAAILILFLILFLPPVEAASSSLKTTSPTNLSQTDSALSLGNQGTSACGQGGACTGANKLYGCGALNGLCGPLTPHAGRLMQSPKNFVIFLNASGYHYNETNYQQKIVQYFKDICTPNAFYDILKQYDAENACSFGGNATYTSPNQASTIDQGQIVDAINNTMNNKGWIPNNGNNSYFLFTPAGITNLRTPSQPDYCAYHSQYPFGPQAKESVVYAFIAYPTGTGCLQQSATDSAIDSASHEQFEAVTDPLGNGWYWNDGAHEIGDQCNGIFSRSTGPTITISGNGYRVQSEWSNIDSGCTYGGPSLVSYGRPKTGGSTPITSPTPITVCQGASRVPFQVFPGGYPELSLGVEVQSGSNISWSLNRTSGTPPFSSALNLTIPSPGTYNVTVYIRPIPYLAANISSSLLIHVLPSPCDLYAGTWSMNYQGYASSTVFTTYQRCLYPCITPAYYAGVNITGEGYWFFQGGAAGLNGQLQGELIAQMMISFISFPGSTPACTLPGSFYTSIEETWSVNIGATVTSLNPITGVPEATVTAKYQGYNSTQGWDACDNLPESLASPPAYLTMIFPDLNAFEDTGTATPGFLGGSGGNEVFALTYYPKGPRSTPSTPTPPPGPDFSYCIQNPGDRSCWTTGAFAAIIITSLLIAVPIFLRNRIRRLRSRRKMGTS